MNGEGYVSPFGPCETCDSSACVCSQCLASERVHHELKETGNSLFGKDHQFDPTDCQACTTREPLPVITDA